MVDIPLLGWGFDRLNDWGENVVDDKMLGHGLRTLRNISNMPGLNVVPGVGVATAIANNPLVAPSSADADKATSAGLTGKNWVDAAYKNSPWQHFGASMLFDPLNLVGVGLPAKALTGVSAGSKLYKALKVADTIDKVPGMMSKPVMDVAGKIAGAGLRGTADALAPHAASFATAHPDITNAISNVNRGWREQALLSPGYHIRNANENLLRPLLETGDTKTTKETLRGMFTGRNRFDDIAPTHGFNTDVDIQKSIGQDPTGLAHGKSVFRKVDFGPKTAPGAVRLDLPTGGALGSNHGEMFGPAGRTLSGRPGYQAINLHGNPVNLGDTASFRSGPLNAAGKRTGQTRGKIVEISDNPLTGNPGITIERNGNTYTFDPGNLLDHKPGAGWAPGAPGPGNTFQQAGNWAAGKVAGGMETNALVGSHIEGAARKAAIATEYERALARGATADQAKQSALKYADDLFFNYSDNPGGVDELGRNLFAFHKFGMHNIPSQLRTAGKRPGMLNVPSEWYRVSDEYNNQQGLPSRFHGELPIGNTGMHINPMNLWSVGQLVGAGTKHGLQEEEGTPLGQTADMAQGIGLGLNPFIDALLTVTGQHGRSFAPSFLRASQPVNGVLSAITGKPVDIEGYPKEFLGKVQEELTGQQPFPYQQYLLNKRRAELKAFDGNPSQAGRDVGNQMALEGLAGFMGVPGLKLLTPEERDIRQNAALAKAYKLAGNTQGYRANPTARTYADLDPRDQKIANWENLSAAERQRLFRDPEVQFQLFDKLAHQLHSGKTNVGGNPFARVSRTG
jgi:hypothetical protein